MTQVHHFSHGLLTPAFAYVMSCMGSALGLLCTSRARAVSGWARVRWLLVAAVSIGGTGIWVMHFIAMLGFAVVGSEVRYDVSLTLASMGVAVVIVGVGVCMVGFGGQRLSPLLFGGLLTGLGVASMHYLGMAAVQVSGHVGYDPLLVAASIVIAVVAATVALWFTVRVRGGWATMAAALIMGVAVNGMHFTAMFAVRVRLQEGFRRLNGAEALEFLLPLIIVIGVISGVLLGIISMSPSEDELRADAEWRARIAAGLHAQPDRSRITADRGTPRVVGTTHWADLPAQPQPRRGAPQPQAGSLFERPSP